MSALETAISEGCPEALFRGLCDWLAEPGSVTDAEQVHFRYSPNTRAWALYHWRLLRDIRAISVHAAGVEVE